MMVVAAAVAFVLSHVLIARTAIKPWLVRRLGEQVYLVLYSLLSLLLLAWLIVAILDVPRTILWRPPLWAPGFALVCTALAFMLSGVGALSPNPYSVSFRKAGFDPQRPGIVGWIQHPLIFGFGLWGLAHIPANGRWPSLLLFAGTALFALLGAWSLQRRYPRPVLARGHVDRDALMGVVCGLVLWGVMLVLHPQLFGVDPLALVSAQLQR